MRPAPPVAVLCTGGRRWRALQAALPALAAAALTAWGLQHAEHASLLPALAVSATIAALAWRLAAPRPVPLAWDGQQWTADGVPGQLAVMIDIGPALLLRLRPQGGGALWLPLTAREAGAAWPALRGAVYSRPPDTTSRVLLPERAAD